MSGFLRFNPLIRSQPPPPLLPLTALYRVPHRAQVAEGCVKEFKPLLNQIVPLIKKGLEDPHERVRHAAITCMSQFCVEFSPDFQAANHATFLPLLMQRMTDVPRVAALAAQSCINFMEGADKEVCMDVGVVGLSHGSLALRACWRPLPQ